MRYLLFSDIHGSLPRLEKALDFYESHHCDMILLGGDIINYGPRNGVPEGLDAPGIVARLNDLADRIVAVRGNCDAEVDQMLLRFPIMADYALVVDEGRKILLTHGHVYHRGQLPPGCYDAVITGHTHLWELERDGGTLYCNTGSITFPKGGNEPTLGIMEGGTITMYTLDGRELKRESM
jgi:putative phosphoesterase